ncbi:SPOR domain-containing protein [Limnobacter humi]|uniref:SPOR domain-containing protein n=1 Tax=Limnobacter humi TaxID=1778671 RepID=A0ABT1WCY2_9BURK|nr:SPOR domain-containing protein [Limnobacter humi]MCQ8895384.1 SPOR domain-containing protein [Limnobacter humi]
MAKTSSAKPGSPASKTKARRSSSGNTVQAFVFGMVFGLLIALGVALFVTRTELPFSGSSTQGADAKPALPDNGSTRDPNAAIYGRANANSAQMVTVDPDQPKAAAPSAPAGAISATSSQPVAQTQYFLQLGSFKNREDAEQLRAKLAFVGSESEISVGEVNGTTVNRVRVGPFSSATEAYQARVPLTKGGFEATVVKE